jgi:DNA ligase (NAD+)
MSKISDLQNKIKTARDEYYNNHSFTVPDDIFDSWVDELKSLDPKNPQVTAVGAPTKPSEWKKVSQEFGRPMGSLSKVNNPADMTSWASGVKTEKLFVTQKLDGISIGLTYVAGNLVSAQTRGAGDGTGDEILSNVKKMKGVKLTLSQPIDVFIRGEIMMTNSVHKQYFADKSNPRNACSGVAKTPSGIGSEHLQVMTYQVTGEKEFETEEDCIAWLKSEFFLTPDSWSFTSVGKLNDFWRDYQDTKRSTLDYDIDGLVVKISDIELQQSLGETDGRSKGAIAYKFDNQFSETEVLDIVFQVGSNSRITPVAVVKPVLLSGAIVERASLYNVANIKKLGIDKGCTVSITRSGDVIPCTTCVTKSTGTVFPTPTECPSCSGPIHFEGEYLVCPNLDCPARVTGSLKNWINELGILEWGDTLLSRIVEDKLIADVAGLYDLSVAQLANIERMGQKSAKKCYDILHSNMEVTLDVFIGGLSIPMIGKSSIVAIMNTGKSTLDQIQSMSQSELENVPGLGPSKSASLASGLIAKAGLIEKLLDRGIKIKVPTAGKLTGKSFAITGSMKTKRAVLEKMISDHGGVVKSSVGKGLSYLIIDDPASESSKAVSARKFNVKLVSEEQFLEMINQ